MLDRVHQIATRLRIGSTHHISHRTLSHQMTATLAGAGANVNDVVGAANGFFVVFNHHQGVALVAQGAQGVQQDVVVTRVQTNGGFVQHITNSLQMTAQLRGQANALRFTTTQSGCAPVQGEVAQTHTF